MVFCRNQRRKKLEDLFWEVGNFLEPNIGTKLSEQERSYYSEYSAIITEYSKSVGFDVLRDIDPPKDLFVEVRVKRNTGTILMGDGFYDFKEGQTHFLKRAEAAPLIKQGFFKQVLGEVSVE